MARSQHDSTSPDRRALLRGALAAAAASATLPLASAAHGGGPYRGPGPSVPPPSQGERRSIRKALKYGMINDPSATTIEEKFALAKRCGFEGIELDSPSGLDEAEFLAAAKSTGLIVEGLVDSAHWKHSLGSKNAETRQKGREALEHALRQAARVGADSVLLVPAVVSANESYASTWKHSVEEVKGIAPLAEELGVRIACENVWNEFLISPIEVCHWLDEVGSDHVGWHFDIGNVLRYGWAAHWIEALGRERLFKLDIKEFSRQKMKDEGLWKGFRVKIGEGDVDWEAVRGALDAIEYSGWAAAEVPGGDAERLADIAARMDRVLAHRD